MNAYVASFWISVGSTGFTVANRIVASESLPTSGEVRDMETRLRDSTPDVTAVVLISVSELGD